MTTKTKSDRFENMCATLAYHATLVMTEPAGSVLRCGLHNPDTGKNVTLRITIEKGRCGDPIWDQTYVALSTDPVDSKGDWAGNRCGGRELLARLYADVMRD